MRLPKVKTRTNLTVEERLDMWKERLHCLETLNQVAINNNVKKYKIQLEEAINRVNFYEGRRGMRVWK